MVMHPRSVQCGITDAHQHVSTQSSFLIFLVWGLWTEAVILCILLLHHPYSEN